MVQAAGLALDRLSLIRRVDNRHCVAVIAYAIDHLRNDDALSSCVYVFCLRVAARASSNEPALKREPSNNLIVYILASVTDASECIG